MRGLQRARWVVGAATFAMIATACGGGGDSGGGSAGGASSAAASSGAATSGGGGGGATGSITIAGTEPENPLVPVNTNETGGGQIVDALFTRLVEYNPETAAPENAVAESITPSADNKTYTIKIKQGWKFHDGTEVKAKNFVDAWNWGANGKNAAKNQYFFEPIAGYADVAGEDEDGDGTLEVQPKSDTLSGLKVVDDYTFTAAMAEPVSNFAVRLGYSAFAPLPDKFFQDPKAFGEAPIGNGPFKFARWNHNVDVALQANPDYAGQDKAKVQDVTFKIYQDTDAAYADLQAGNLDVLEQVPTSALAGDRYKTDLQDRFVEQPTGVIQTITLPQYRPGYKNPNLGKAISMALNREQIISNVLPGRVPATGWVSPVVEGYKPGAAGEFTTYNPTRAKELFQQSGFTGDLTLSYNADGDHKPWVDAACVSISNALGVKCTGKPYVDFATLRKDVGANKMTSLFRTGWQMDYPSIENFLTPLYATDASSNDGRYSNKQFDRLLAEAAAAQGPESIAKYQQAEALLVNDFPVIPLWYGAQQAGYSDKVDNVRFTPFSFVDLTNITVKS